MVGKLMLLKHSSTVAILGNFHLFIKFDTDDIGQFEVTDFGTALKPKCDLFAVNNTYYMRN